MKRHWLICGLVLILALCIGLSMRRHPNVRRSVSLIHVRQSSIDLGTVPLTDDLLLFDYQIENWGNAPLRIEGTILSCGCTQPELPESEIAPNESARVRFRIDPEAAGEKQVSVLLLTNDPLNPRYALRAKWVATNGISASPPNLAFGTVEAGQPTVQTVNLSKLDDRIRIKSVTGEPDVFQTQLDGNQVTVTLVPKPYPMSGAGVVRVTLEGAKTRPFLIPVSWRVDHAYQAHPANLFLGYTAPGNELTGVIHIKDRESRDVAIDHWEWTEELAGAHCEATKDEMGHDQLTVNWTAPSTAVLHRGVVSVRVSDHTIQVPVSALVGKVSTKDDHAAQHPEQ